MTEQLGPRARLLFGWVFSFEVVKLEQMLTSGLNHSSVQSEPPDIVIFNAGLPAGVIPDAQGLQDSVRGAPAFAKMLEKVLQARPGLHFYWRPSTWLCNSTFEGGKHAALNPEVRAINSVVEAYVCAVPGVLKLDAFAWTQHACHHYDKGPKGRIPAGQVDPLHHLRLGFSHVTTLLSYECGIAEENGECL